MENNIVAFLDNLVARDYTAVTNMLSPEVRESLTMPYQVLVAGKHGDMLDYTVTGSAEHEGMYIATVSANHAKGAGQHQVFADANGAILGLQAISTNLT